MEVDADSFDHIKRSTSNATLTNEALMSNMEECVRQLVNDCDLSISHIRSSNCLRDLFNQMVLSIAERGYIQSWGLYCMKARLDSLQQLAIDQLTIPTYMTALGVGSRNISSILSVFSPSNGSSRNDQSLEGQVRTLLKDIFLLFVRSENELIRHGNDGLTVEL